MKTGSIYAMLFIFAFIITAISSCKKKKIVEETNKVSEQMQVGIWQAQRFIDAGEDETNHFVGFNFIFGENQLLTITNGSTSYSGTWFVERDENNDKDCQEIDFVIHLTVDNEFQDLTEAWDVIYHSEEKLDLKSISNGESGGDYLTFKRL